MMVTGSEAPLSPPPPLLVRKIKVRQQLAEASRKRSSSLSGSRAAATTRRLNAMANPRTSAPGAKSSQLDQPKPRRILVDSSSNSSNSSSSNGRSSPVLSPRARNHDPPAESRKQRARVDGRARLQPLPGQEPAIPKSASVPADLRASVGILRRSGSFLASLEPRGLCSLLRRRGRNLGQEREELGPHAGTGRKCVSFSADTSFGDRRQRQQQQQQPSCRKTAVHEAKVYRKGVLQDRDGREEHQANLPLSWEESLGGPKALLGAAQDGDDELIKKIVTLANKAGLGNVDVNAVDASGRTAISYMAGNGSALMLEACLSFVGIDANLPDNEGNTPLHFAAQAGQTECLNILLQRCPSIEVDARNSLGFTPLMKAALQGRTKCAKILLFADANPTLRDHGRGLRAEQWARFCGRYVCAEVIERFARHRLLEKSTSCRWGSEPELATQLLQGKLMPVPPMPVQPPPSSGLKSKIRRVFRTSSSSETKFSLVSQLTSAALCASSPVLPKPTDVSPVVKSLLRPLSVPQLRISFVSSPDNNEKVSEKCTASYAEKIESSIVKPPRVKKKNKAA